jgi:hypothetical protein
MPIADAKFKRLTPENVERSPRKPGVYALYDDEKTLMFLGEAAGRYSIRGRLRGHLEAEPSGATRYKREACDAPAQRLKELLREHVREHGGPPRGNR